MFDLGLLTKVWSYKSIRHKLSGFAKGLWVTAGVATFSDSALVAKSLTVRPDFSCNLVWKIITRNYVLVSHDP